MDDRGTRTPLQLVGILVSCSMGFAQKKINIAKAILKIEDESLLAQIQLLIEDDSSDWYNTLSQSQKSDIEHSIAQLQQGKVSSFSAYLDKKLDELS